MDDFDFGDFILILEGVGVGLFVAIIRGGSGAGSLFIPFGFLGGLAVFALVLISKLPDNLLLFSGCASCLLTLLIFLGVPVATMGFIVALATTCG